MLDTIVRIDVSVCNITFMLTIFTESAGNIFLRLTDLYNISKHTVYCMLKFCKLSGLRRSDW